jgi:hypothetical protein
MIPPPSWGSSKELKLKIIIFLNVPGVGIDLGLDRLRPSPPRHYRCYDSLPTATALTFDGIMPSIIRRRSRRQFCNLPL